MKMKKLRNNLYYRQPAAQQVMEGIPTKKVWALVVMFSFFCVFPTPN